jgi:hypothetical protein
MPHGRIGSQFLLWPWWRWLQLSECCQVFENDGPWLSISILGTSKNHMVTNLENKEPTEAWECIFSPEIHELTMLCVGGTLSWWSPKDPIICNLHSNSHHPISQMVQDFKITFLLNVTPGGMNSLWTTLQELKTKWWPQSSFLFAHDNIVLFRRLSRCHSLVCLLFSWSYSKNQISLPTLHFNCVFWLSFTFFGTISAHILLMFKFCVTIWWTVHSLIISSTVITGTIKRWSWWMKALTWLCLCLFSHRRGIQIVGHLSTFLAHLQILCDIEILHHVIENH